MEMTNSIFFNAINNVKKCHLNLRKNPQQVFKEFPTEEAYPNDEEIDFEKEAEILGNSMEYEENPPTKMRSAVMKTNRTRDVAKLINCIPYPVSKPKVSISLNQLRNNPSGDKLLIKDKGKLFLKQPSNSSNTNNLWKHDLCNEALTYKYSIFIRNMPRILTEQKLRELFSVFGNIIGINIERETAEIFYERKDQAIKAATQSNGASVFGKNLKVTYYEANEETADTEVKQPIITLSKRDDIWDRIKLSK